MSPATTEGTARSTADARPASWLRTRLPALLAALLCGVLAIYLALNAQEASHVRRANELGAQGRYAEAAREAARVTRAPAEAAALVARARALTGQRDLEAADAAWARAARRSPNDWQLHFEWATAVFVLGGDPARVLRIYERARELNPFLAPLA